MYVIFHCLFQLNVDSDFQTGSYTYGGAGIHLWNVTPDMFEYFQKVITEPTN